MGENLRVPVATSNTGVNTTNGISYGAIYPLQLGPVENTFTATTDSIVVYGTSLNRSSQSSLQSLANPTATPVISNESSYAIDYDNLKIAFYPRLKDASRPGGLRQFTISYDYFVNSGGFVALQFQPNAFDPSASISTIVTIPDVDPPITGGLPLPVWQPLFNSASLYQKDPSNTFATSVALNYIGMAVPVVPAIYFGPSGFLPYDPTTTYQYGIVRDSEDVARKFRLALPNNTVENGGIPAWSNGDPYEYAWYSKQSANNSVNPGILIFNPSGHNQTVVNSTGSQPLKARVDYRIFDNHVMRDDRNIPESAAGPFYVSLSVPFLKLGGDVQDNQNPLNTFNAALNPYNGIYRDIANVSPDIIIYDASTGLKLGDWTNTLAIPGTGVLLADVNDPLPVDQKTGVLTLNPNVVAANKLQGESIRVFYRTQRNWGTQLQKATAHYRQTVLPTGVDFRHYFVGTTSVGGTTRVYFAPCDAGKSIIIGEFYTSGHPTPPIWRNQIFQITADPQQFAVVGGQRLPFIDVTTIDPLATGIDPTTTGRRLNNVLGCSVKSRVIWQDGSRWRKIDNDSILVQAPSQ